MELTAATRSFLLLSGAETRLAGCSSPQTLLPNEPASAAAEPKVRRSRRDIIDDLFMILLPAFCSVSSKRTAPLGPLQLGMTTLQESRKIPLLFPRSRLPFFRQMRTMPRSPSTSLAVLHFFKLRDSKPAERLAAVVHEAPSF